MICNQQAVSNCNAYKLKLKTTPNGLKAETSINGAKLVKLIRIDSREMLLHLLFLCLVYHAIKWAIENNILDLSIQNKCCLTLQKIHYINHETFKVMIRTLMT